MAAIFQLATDTSVEPNLLYRAAVIDVVVPEVYDITSHMTHTSPSAPAIPFIKRCLREPKKGKKTSMALRDCERHADGAAVGLDEGAEEGEADGEVVGVADGAAEGDADGAAVGAADGDAVGGLS